MGTLQIMQLLPPPAQEPDSHEDAVESLRAEQLIGIQISSPSHGFRVHGSLKSISRGGLQVLTPLAVPIRCPLRVSIAGCRSVGGEALYCLKRSMLYQVGMVFSSRQKPNIALGDLATIDTLETPFVKGRGSILDIGNSSVSILCKTAIAPEERVRLESSGWVLFGVVKDVVATSMVGRCLEVHLQAAFPADSNQRSALAVMPSAADAETVELKEENQ
jgi:hypothetical protein